MEEFFFVSLMHLQQRIRDYFYNMPLAESS